MRSRHRRRLRRRIAMSPEKIRDVDLELVNLNTATAATEIWFNSNYHLGDAFPGSKPPSNWSSGIRELSSHDPMPDVTAKAHLMPPPIDLNLIPHVKATGRVPKRDPRAIFVDTRDAATCRDCSMPRLAESGFARRETFRLITVGPVEELSDHWPRRTISETDDIAHVLGLWNAGVVLSDPLPGAALRLAGDPRVAGRLPARLARIAASTAR